MPKYQLLPLPQRGLLSVVMCWFAAAAMGDVVLNSLFTDNMVLQRGAPIRLYGTATGDEHITVQLAGKKAETQAKGGKWKAVLDPVAAGGPYTMTVTASNTLTLKNVMVGDVWLCTGQSNMASTLVGYIRSRKYKNYQYLFKNIPGKKTLENIRLFKQAKAAADTPQVNTKPDKEFGTSWRVCDPGAALQFSAAGYFFGRELAQHVKVPIGLIYATVGGTAAESWVSHDVLKSRPEFKSILDNYQKAVSVYPEAFKAYQNHLAQWREQRKAHKKVGRPPRPPMGPTHIKRPSGLYNQMIAPLQRFAIKGAIWYQGESNARRPEQYATLFPALITSWRKQWGQGDFPFLFVQLAAFHKAYTERPRDASWPWLREAQTKALALPNTAMAVIIDAGLQENIHPPFKQTVGHRLVLAALHVAYGQKDVAFSGPMFKSMTVEGAKAIITFSHTDGGLQARAVDLDGHKLPADKLRGFAICGPDHRFVWANAVIDGDRVVVSSPKVAKPIAVRYAWDDFPLCNLYNGPGLPASPFRTDHLERGASERVSGIAVGKPVVSDHPIHHPRGFFKGLTDGSISDNPNTIFGTNAAMSFPKEATVNLQGKYTVTAIRVYNSSFGGTKDVLVQVSSDGKTFRTVGKTQFANYMASEYDLNGLSEKGVMAVRLVFQDVHATSFMHKANGFVFIRELQVLGTPE